MSSSGVWVAGRINLTASVRHVLHACKLRLRGDRRDFCTWGHPQRDDRLCLREISKGHIRHCVSSQNTLRIALLAYSGGAALGADGGVAAQVVAAADAKPHAPPPGPPPPPPDRQTSPHAHQCGRDHQEPYGEAYGPAVHLLRRGAEAIGIEGKASMSILDNPPPADLDSPRTSGIEMRDRGVPRIIDQQRIALTMQGSIRCVFHLYDPLIDSKNNLSRLPDVLTLQRLRCQ